MLPLTTQLKGLLKCESITTDTAGFRIFHKGAVWVHLLCLAFMGYSYFGNNPMECDNSSSRDHVPSRIMNLYCYTTGVYTILEYSQKAGTDITPIYQGIGVQIKGYNWTQVFHHSYKWTPLLLCGFIVLFYMPRAAWKLIENGQMENICQGLHVQVSIIYH